MEGLRKGLLAVSTLGMVLSGIGYGVVHFGRDSLEDGVREVVVAKTEHKIHDLVTPRPAETEGRRAALRNRAAEMAAAAARHALGEGYPERLRKRLSNLCVCRMSDADVAEAQAAYANAKAEVRRAMEAALERRFDEAKLAPGTVSALIDGYYINTVEGLVRDLRIFFGLNIVLYLMVATVSRFGGTSPAVLASAGLLLVSNVAAGVLQLFEQNWLATIVLNAWTGYGYLVLVAILFVYYGYWLFIISHRLRVARAPVG